ncbi:hypothetical protein IT882_11755 [Microbacterium schleiferi]|uniref:Uncharacterized protein n=1 Tax=Microbacterium schleiferi TaxID=69362 RepID=A0A7S8MWG0_9MICO|nr:hypothetical protein [Microbacterium schleiferi]QPE03918.1 hypothetical protein IT882_11755 [Microbacterium schleiferi]
MDDLDETLRNARAKTDDPAVVTAVHVLAAARTRRTPQRRRILAPAIGFGAALVLVGGGAMAAGGWAPWNITDPDLAFTRSWTDVDGNFVGFCETRMKADVLPTQEVQDAARAYLSDLDIANMAPDSASVAVRLAHLDRADRLSHLIPGADMADFDFTLVGGPQPDPTVSDAHVLQEALAVVVFNGMAKSVFASFPDDESLFVSGVGGEWQTQCSTDATETPAP